MNDDVAIKVEGLYKDFRLPHEKNNSIKQSLLSALRPGHLKIEQQHALKDISFEVKKGEFFGIVGRNGSGKSTLLKILAGIYQPSKGSVQVNGRLVPFIELGVGFNPELSGRENVFLNGALLGFSEKEITEMYDEIVAFAELEKFMDQKLKNYSSGMQVRLAFSIAIRADSDILLIDEVLAVGDTNFQKKCLKYFSKLKGSRKTVIFISHDMSAVENYCDRACILENGAITNIGNVAKVIQQYKVVNSNENSSINTIGDEWGTREVKIKNVTFNTEDNSSRKNNTFKTGDEFSLAVDLINDNSLPVVVGVAFEDQYGVVVSGPNSIKYGAKVAKKITLKTSKLPFSEGDYFVTIVVFDKDAITEYHHLDKCYKISVISDRPIYGKATLFESWSHE